MKTALKINEGVVSKETVVLRRCGSSIQKFGFINGVDNVNWPPALRIHPEKGRPAYVSFWGVTGPNSPYANGC